MNSSVSAKSVHFDDNSLFVDLNDGRSVSVPLVWFPRLLHATHAQRVNCTISSRGLHWEELDEDISVSGLLEGRGDMTNQPQLAA